MALQGQFTRGASETFGANLKSEYGRRSESSSVRPVTGGLCDQQWSKTATVCGPVVIMQRQPSIPTAEWMPGPVDLPRKFIHSAAPRYQHPPQGASICRSAPGEHYADGEGTVTKTRLTVYEHCAEDVAAGLKTGCGKRCYLPWTGINKAMIEGCMPRAGVGGCTGPHARPKCS